MSQTRFDTLVLGAGYAGLFAAHRLSLQGAKVLVVEAAPEIGGLMRSLPCPDRPYIQFDIGTHFALLTGDPDIDGPLAALIPDGWLWFDGPLAEGHSHAGRLAPDTGCLDLTGHPDIAAFRADFAAAPGDGDRAETLERRWLADFGPRITNDILAPIARKHTGLAPSGLAPGAMEVFAPPRLKLFDGPGVAARKAADPAFDRRIAHEHRSIGATNIRKAYPRAGGVGAFVTAMAADIEHRGGKVLAGAAPAFADWAPGAPLHSVTVAEQALAFDRFVTGLAPAVVARALGAHVPPAPFAARDLALAHWLSDRPYASRELHWVTVYDPETPLSRVTLYANIAPGAPYRLTAEAAIGAGDPDPDPLRLAADMAARGIIDDPADWRLVRTDRFRAAFPVLLPGWQGPMAAQAAALQDLIPNLTGVGAAAGQPFGQLRLMRSITDTLG
jgi:protoporphyrinogen oxidase